MSDKSKILIFIDEETQPIAELEAPITLDLDTRKLTDGHHSLKIVSKDPTGKEGIRVLPFVVRNGPAISVDGIKEHDVVDGILPLMINAYSKGDQKSFLIDGSETPRSIPSWVWIIIITFIAWAMYYMIRYFK